MMRLAQMVRLVETVRHVPVRALLWRVRARAMGIYYRTPLFGLRDVGMVQVPMVQFVGPQLLTGDRDKGEAMAEGTFTLAGKPVVLRMPEAHATEGRGMGWFPPQVSALGHFELHYHEWLADLRAAGERDVAQRLVADWLVQFGGTYHRVAWHPYPTSLRLVAWLTHGVWLLDGADEDLADALKAAMVRQLLYLEHNLEWDLGGNHLLKDIKALIYGAVCVEGQDGLLARALALLVRELRVQILPDGSHYERTPLYTAQVLKDVLDIRALLRKVNGGAPVVLDEVAHKLGTALAFYTHGDGKLALLNDGAEGDERTVATLLRLSGAEEPPAVLPAAGYARLARGAALVILDAGKVGPDENPGHAHADTLSFEFSLGRERVVVNQGTYAYQDRLRNTLRGTAAHSTVCVDGQNSADVWGAFRVGRRPWQVGLDVKGDDGAEAVAVGAHDGYAYMGVNHARKWVLAADGSRLRGEDELTYTPTWRAWLNGFVLGVKPPVRAVAHFHIHPAVQVRLVADDEAELTLESGLILKMTVRNGRLDVRQSLYAPQFGVQVPGRQIVLHGRFAKGVCRMEWGFERVKTSTK